MKPMPKEVKEFLLNEVDFLFDSNEGSEYSVIGDIIEHPDNDKVIIRIHKADPVQEHITEIEEDEEEFYLGLHAVRPGSMILVSHEYQVIENDPMEEKMVVKGYDGFFKVIPYGAIGGWFEL